MFCNLNVYNVVIPTVGDDFVHRTSFSVLLFKNQSVLGGVLRSWSEASEEPERKNTVHLLWPLTVACVIRGPPCKAYRTLPSCTAVLIVFGFGFRFVGTGVEYAQLDLPQGGSRTW